MTQDQPNGAKPEFIPQPIRISDGFGGPDFGPRDIMRDKENPNMLVPPVTDNGLLPNMRFSFSDTHMQLNKGGWSREITARDLPIATTLAGINMSLLPGGVRELHWHQQAEWAFMIWGCARVTSVDWQGRNFIADIEQGDLWYFPAGLPHSIQALEGGCEFLLVFDDGNFSDLNTLSISDWFAHTPKDVLAANFGVPMHAFDGIPTKQVYIFQDKVPGSLESQEVQSPYGTVPLSFKHSMLAQEPIVTPGGTVRITDSSNFPIAKTIAAALVEIKPGAMRELHWHPNNDEWQYYLSGQGRMTVFGGNGSRPNVRLPRRRCRLRAVRDGPLRAEHGQGHALVPGNVQSAAIRGYFPEPVDGLDAPAARERQLERFAGADEFPAESQMAGREIPGALTGASIPRISARKPKHPPILAY